MIDTLRATIEQQAKDRQRERERRREKKTMSERKKEEKEAMLKNHLPLCVSHSTTTQYSNTNIHTL
jgi:hypothetical protein